MNISNKVFGLIVVSILAIYFTILAPIADYYARKAFLKFDISTINNIVSNVVLNKNGATVYLFNASSFKFYPDENKFKSMRSNDSSFIDIVKIGDHIKKNSRSDTIYVIKNTRTIPYGFNTKMRD